MLSISFTHVVIYLQKGTMNVLLQSWYTQIHIKLLENSGGLLLSMVMHS